MIPLISASLSDQVNFIFMVEHSGELKDQKVVSGTSFRGSDRRL
jgi:hypothetical protein